MDAKTLAKSASTDALCHDTCESVKLEREEYQPHKRDDEPNRIDSMKTEVGKKFTLMQAIGINTMNMFGTGPLITIPYCLAAVDPMGPHAMVGYVVAVIACTCDSLVWAELGSMWPHSGGPYIYLRKLYGEDTWGRLVSFMYIWQFFISCPCEAASGFIAVAEYLVYFDQALISYHYRVTISLACVALCGTVLYRKVDDIGRAVIVLWSITIFAMVYTVVAGFSDFHPEYLIPPSDAFTGGFRKTVMIVAASTRFGVYDMSGYYAVCFMGGMLEDPRRNIPRSCITTAAIVGFIFILCYVAVLGHLDWRNFVQFYGDDYAGNPVGIMSLFTESLIGRWAAYIATIVVAVTIFGATFSMMAGQPHVPYAAAKDGIFFEIFGHESQRHPGVPDVSLATILCLSSIFCFFSLKVAVDVLVTMIVAIMFMGQSIGLLYYRYTVPKEKQATGWRMPLFPLPCIIQIIIFFFIWISTDSVLLWGSEQPILELSCVFLMMGPVLFIFHAKRHETWPFENFEGKKSKADCSDKTLEAARPQAGKRKDLKSADDPPSHLQVDHVLMKGFVAHKVEDMPIMPSDGCKFGKSLQEQSDTFELYVDDDPRDHIRDHSPHSPPVSTNDDSSKNDDSGSGTSQGGPPTHESTDETKSFHTDDVSSQGTGCL